MSRLKRIPDLTSIALDVHGHTIVGVSETHPGGTFTPVTWVHRHIEALPDDGFGGVAQAINKHEVIVGETNIDFLSGIAHAALWRNHQLISLHPPEAVNSLALAINDAGFVVGTVDGEGTLWLPFGGTVPLPPLDGDGSSAAGAINDTGVIVGTSNESVTPHVVRWDDGVPTALLSLTLNGEGWALITATGISNDGVIVGQGTLNGEDRAYMLTPQQAVAEKHGKGKGSMRMAQGE